MTAQCPPCHFLLAPVAFCYHYLKKKKSPCWNAVPTLESVVKTEWTSISHPNTQAYAANFKTLCN